MILTGQQPMDPLVTAHAPSLPPNPDSIPPNDGSAGAAILKLPLPPLSADPKVAADEEVAAALRDWEVVRPHSYYLLFFKPDPSAVARFPNFFRAMTSTRKGTVSVHGRLHVTLGPTCWHTNGEDSFHDLHHTFEDLLHQFDDIAHSPLPIQQRTRAPSSKTMRLACEALHAYSHNPTTSPDETLLSYLLLHDIGARDTDFETFLDLDPQHPQDSWAARLLYKALCVYDTETCAISNAAGVWACMRPLFEAVLPKGLHEVSDDEDDDE